MKANRTAVLGLVLVFGVAASSPVKAGLEDDVVVHCEDSCSSATITATLGAVVVSSPRLTANLTVLDALITTMPEGRFYAFVNPNGTFDGLYHSADLTVAWTSSGEVYRLNQDNSTTLLYDQTQWRAGPTRLKRNRHTDE